MTTKSAPPSASSQQLFVVMSGENIWNTDQPLGSAFMSRAARALLPELVGARAVAVPGASVEGAMRRRRDTAAAFLNLPQTSPGARVIDQVAPKETTLVSMSDAQRLQLLRDNPSLRVVSVVEVEPLWLRPKLVAAASPAAASVMRLLEVKVVDALTGNPVAGADVVGYLDRSARVGTLNVTNARGVAKLAFSSADKLLEVLEAHPPSGHWPAYVSKFNLKQSSVELRCQPIDISVPDARTAFGLVGSDSDGKGVIVGVVDSGCAKHPDLAHVTAINVVKDEPERDGHDYLGHGSHVAGIIGARGKAGVGVRGVAPGVTMRSYRVYAKDAERALSFNIAKGIRRAVDDGCHIINLSLGIEADVIDVLREINRARALGVVVVAASGNDYRSGVRYPARYPQVLAVSAAGHTKTYPKGSAQELCVMKPFGKDKANYLADFSNTGPELDLTGPGVGIVSTHPAGYAVMDGTSMACPAAVGHLARLLAKHAAILAGAGDQARSDKIVKLALSGAKALGFGARFEGAGLLA